MENANQFEMIAFTEEKKKYDIKIEIKNNKLIISTSKSDNIYKLENDYEKLRANAIFMGYDNIYEIYEAIKDYIKINANQKKAIDSVVKEKENSLILTIPLSLEKFKEINFELTKENLSLKEASGNLNDRINNLENLVEKQNKVIEKQNIIIEEQNKKIETLNKEIIEIKNELNKLKNGKEVYNNISNESKNLLIHKNEYDLIYNWILPNANIKFELIYKASVDGDSAENFHKKCDNIGKPTLVVIQSNNGYRFGGYTTGNWGIYNDQEDANAFVFSLTNKVKVKVQSPNEPCAISPYNSLGPRFGCATIWISSNCLSNKESQLYYNSRYKINVNQFIGIDSKDTVYFRVNDYEVYKVIFN